MKLACVNAALLRSRILRAKPLLEGCGYMSVVEVSPCVCDAGCDASCHVIPRGFPGFPHTLYLRHSSAGHQESHRWYGVQLNDTTHVLAIIYSSVISNTCTCKCLSDTCTCMCVQTHVHVRLFDITSLPLIMRTEFHCKHV